MRTRHVYSHVGGLGRASVADRNARIAVLFLAGQSPRAIGEQFGLKYPYVTEILRRLFAAHYPHPWKVAQRSLPAMRRLLAHLGRDVAQQSVVTADERGDLQ